MTYYLGVDIGGTFTDCVAVDDAGQIFHAKTPSTHNPVEGVLKGLELLAQEVGVVVGGLYANAARLGHGTTIGTNLVVERKGARVGLVATAGHGDALTMMRGNGRTAGAPPDQVFSVHATDKPAPLVMRGNVVEVSERVSADGEVLAPLDLERAREQIAALIAGDNGRVDAVAISLLWSFQHPAHEQRLSELVHELSPDTYVSLSSDTSPRQGEFERTVATVLNSYVGPDSSRYLSELEEATRRLGLQQPVLIMQSGGGVVPVEVARRFPVQTIGSGPAGGVAGTALIAASSGHRNVIATDMGGTSFEVGLIIEGQPVTSGEQVIDRYTFHASQLDVRSIACGGGSIASMDPYSGALRVGPESAGSDPGPACYGQATEPTVTDADVVLGLIDPETFLDGRMRLDAKAARRAVASVAGPLGLSTEQAAAGIVHVNNQKAALLIRQRTIEQGLDPRDFALYVFGGAGPVHAFAFAEELGIHDVVIPLGNGAATLSAYGIAATDVVRTFESRCSLYAPFDVAELGRVVEGVEQRAAAAMRESGFDREAVVFERVAVMRYAEQFLHDLPLPMPPGPVAAELCERLAADFDREYARLYGEGARSIFQAVEIFGVRVRARVPLAFVPAIPSAAAENGVGRTVASDRVRQVYWPEEGGWVPTAVHDGRSLQPGNRVNGPAVVELPYTTVAVSTGSRLTLDPVGNYVLSTG